MMNTFFMRKTAKTEHGLFEGGTSSLGNGVDTSDGGRIVVSRMPDEARVLQRLRAHAVCHPGFKRAHKPNEDTYGILHAARQFHGHRSHHAGLFLVADGMGGHADGRYASRLVTEKVLSEMEPLLNDPNRKGDELKYLFVAAVRKANMLLSLKNEETQAQRGTTLTGVMIVERSLTSLTGGGVPELFAHIINVGDSRTYLYSALSGLTRITRDHSVVETLIASQLITPEERYTDRRRNQLHRCLGASPEVEVDVFTIPLIAQDRLLLCSDGLWEMVRDPAISSILARPAEDPSLVAYMLLQAALDNGGDDNITALVIDVPG